MTNTRVFEDTPPRDGPPRRVLVIAPHPDDEIAGCGGALFLHRRWGEPVAIVYVTDGGRSTALGLTPRRMAEVRRAEAESVTELLRPERAEWLGLAEGEWRFEELELPLHEILESFRPGLLYLPSRVDFHPDHVRVAACVSAVLSARTETPLVRVFQVQVPLTATLTNVVLPIDSVAFQLRQAIAIYSSQRGSLERCCRMRRYAGRLYGAGDLAEEFWQLEVHQYRSIHELSGADEEGSRYRGLRYFAMSDPLSYIVGLGGRRRLLALSRATTTIAG